MKKINLKPNFSDERGSITDLLTNIDINSITMISFKKGAVRANHFHKKTIQWNYIVSGEILFVSQLIDGEKKELVLKKGDFVKTIENEKHALKGLADSEVLILTKGPRAGEEYENDTFRLDEALI